MEVIRLSDQIQDGVYFFGGKNAKGELSNQIKFLKPNCIDNKVVSAEWQKIKQAGTAPCGRVGHSMSYLAIN